LSRRAVEWLPHRGRGVLPGASGTSQNNPPAYGFNCPQLRLRTARAITSAMRGQATVPPQTDGALLRRTQPTPHHPGHWHSAYLSGELNHRRPRSSCLAASAGARCASAGRNDSQNRHLGGPATPCPFQKKGPPWFHVSGGWGPNSGGGSELDRVGCLPLPGHVAKQSPRTDSTREGFAPGNVPFAQQLV
jgi:hypothetical protein